jgi:hypothetical protein
MNLVQDLDRIGLGAAHRGSSGPHVHPEELVRMTSRWVARVIAT